MLTFKYSQIVNMLTANVDGCHCISDKSESNFQTTMNYQGNKHVSGAESRKIKKRKDGEDKVLSDGMSQWLKKQTKNEKHIKST